MTLTGFKLAPRETYYTFEKLVDAPDYSLAGKTLIDLPAVKSFEGKPWEVFEANGFVYDFTKDAVVPIASITQTTRVRQAGNVYVSPGLILPGSLTAEGLRVTDYAAWYSRSRGADSWLYAEVTLV